MAITLNGTTGISSPGGDTSTSLATTNLSYTGTLTGGTGVIAIGTNQIYKDASGNLGLGVTPSAWVSNRKVLQVGGLASAALALNGTGAVGEMFFNCYQNTSGTYNYSQSSYAAIVDFNSSTAGGFTWRLAGSGTGGGSCVPSSAMTLDASGRLGLGGVTSPGTVLQVGNSSYDPSTTTSMPAIYTSGNYGGGIALLDGGTLAGFYTQSSGTELRIYVGKTSTDSTGSKVVALFNSSGNLLIGYTGSSSGRLYIKTATSDSTSFAFNFINSSSTALMYQRSDGYINFGLAASAPYNITTANTANAALGSDGGLYRSTSSAKYKNSITNAVHGLTEVLKLRPVTYKGNNDGDTVFGGLIAEEVHDVGLTEFVQYNDAGEPDALAYGNMVSLAFKAIQELSAKVTALEAK